MYLPRVFILNYAGHRITDAQNYGDLIPLTEGNIALFDVDRLAFNMIEKLKRYHFDIKNDFIIPSGSPVIGFVCGFLLGNSSKDAKFVKLLIWDAKTRKYVQREWSI